MHLYYYGFGQVVDRNFEDYGLARAALLSTATAMATVITMKAADP